MFELKEKLSEKMKTYKEICKEYQSKDCFIYRTAKEKRFYHIGIPSVRKRVDEKEYESYEPIWYSWSQEGSLMYGDKETKTYKYLPKEKYDGKPLKFLDLTGENRPDVFDWMTKRDLYYLDIDLIRDIYFAIFSKKKVHTPEKMKAAYGFSDGRRNSQYDIDRWFTLELFHLVQDLEMTENCIFMGYFHANVHAGIEDFVPGFASLGVIPFPST